MATQRPISTISYNSEKFLLDALRELYKAHAIQSFMYIRHKGEDGGKDHIHLRIEPNRRLDPMDIADKFIEHLPSSDKPLSCRPFRPSKEEDWILYAVHDPDYMKLKYPFDKDGKIEYSWEDIKAPANFDVEEAYIRAKSSLRHSSASLVNRLNSGSNALDLIREGESPMTVNSILSALYRSQDYTDLVIELDKMSDLYRTLDNRVYQIGFKFNVETGNLEPIHDMAKAYAKEIENVPK